MQHRLNIYDLYADVKRLITDKESMDRKSLTTRWEQSECVNARLDGGRLIEERRGDGQISTVRRGQRRDGPLNRRPERKRAIPLIGRESGRCREWKASFAERRVSLGRDSFAC